jgi:hypothetical protein
MRKAYMAPAIRTENIEIGVFGCYGGGNGGFPLKPGSSPFTANRNKKSNKGWLWNFFFGWWM